MSVESYHVTQPCGNYWRISLDCLASRLRRCGTPNWLHETALAVTNSRGHFMGVRSNLGLRNMLDCKKPNALLTLEPTTAELAVEAYFVLAYT